MYKLEKSLLFMTLNQTWKNFCTKSLVLKKKPRKRKVNVSKENPVKLDTTKKKTKVIARLPSDYCEDLWLDGLNAYNLKLYRKTSFGSFRKINIDNLIKKLKAIYPELSKLGENPEATSTSKLQESGKVKSQKKSQELASPQLSEFLVQNMLNFPMLKNHSQNSLISVFEDEKNDFGVVDSVNFPSVTRILHETMSTAAKKRLEDWTQAMIQKMGEKEFQKYSKDLLNQGAKLHRCLKTYLETKNKDEVVVDPEITGCWNSLDKLLPDITDVKMVEEHVHHPVLMYKGIVDCVANYRDSPCVIEWKKSGKLKSNLSDTYDAPLQLCAYLGALSWQKSFLPVTQGLVVVAYSTGCPADVFLMDSERCQLYWMEWLKRLQAYWVKKSSVLVKHELEM